MRILKATLNLLGGDRPGIHHMDAIEHEGQVWLVPEWLDFHAEGVTMPARIVSLATIPHDRTSVAGMEIVVSFPVPAAVFFGSLREDAERSYTVIERPDIRLLVRH